MEEFACFKWIALNKIPRWKDVEPCLEYLIGKEFDVDDAKCFDQICNWKQFVESYLQDEESIKLPTHKKWCKYFDQSKNTTCHSEILRIVQFSSLIYETIFQRGIPLKANVEVGHTV